ncbi:hypothetical protein [Variovorax sp. PMC12]|uniref:hypothetical protein n=1 Tax=Variovorax sp. PMC12 TaxID=2126319 RepID=UPI000D11806B|nr:hypothetical protein [Variovorax sp. PMC12]AVQ81666.1 hypothetical protein C4F17_12300 [Variovorax sp. PMC12]
MTVIAWDGKTLAADKRAVHAGYTGGTVTKIHRWPGGLCAFSGDLDVGVQLVEWLRAGAVPADFPKLQTENAANFLVIHVDGSVCQYERTPVPLVFEEGRRAMGSGRDFALAAMHLGHDARAAVEVACALDSGCGNGIDVLMLENVSIEHRSE